MALNTGIFKTIVGLLKLATVVIGLIDAGLVGDKHIFTLESEDFFLGMVIAMFIISTVLLVLLFLGLLNENDLFIKIDLGYHIIGGILLLIGSVCWFISVTDKKNYYGCLFKLSNGGCDDGYAQRIFAGIFGVLNGVLYVTIGALIFLKNRQSLVPTAGQPTTESQAEAQAPAQQEPPIVPE